MLDEPMYLNFRRNPIQSLDIPGAFSPPPGMPFFRGGDALASYFVESQGIRYLAFVDSPFSKGLYRREIWFERLFDYEEIWRVYAPYFLNFFDNLDELKATRKILYEHDGMFLLDLASR